MEISSFLKTNAKNTHLCQVSICVGNHALLSVTQYNHGVTLPWVLGSSSLEGLLEVCTVSIPVK